MEHAHVIGTALPENSVRKIAKAAQPPRSSPRATTPKAENPIAVTQTVAGRTCPGLVRLPAPETLRQTGTAASKRNSDESGRTATIVPIAPDDTIADIGCQLDLVLGL